MRVFRGAFCAYVILSFFGSLRADEPVSVERLADETQLPLVNLDRGEHISRTAFKGSYFIYHPPIEGKTPFGVLHPTGDQSFHFERPKKDFWPAVRDDRVTVDVASTIRDKAIQLKRQAPYSGPKPLGLGVVTDAGGERDLVLLVEHVSGVTLPSDAESRDRELNDQIYLKFLSMVDDGFIPLDFRDKNIVIDSATGDPRPVDVYLAKLEELTPTFHRHPLQYQFRMLQLAQTAREIDRHATDQHPLGYVCRSILRHLRDSFPDEQRWEQSIIRERE